MRILPHDHKPAHFKMDFGDEDGFSADNQDEENNFEIVADLLEESDFQIGKEDDLNNDVSFIYVHRISFIVSRCKNNFRVVFAREDFLQTCLVCAPSFLAYFFLIFRTISKTIYVMHYIALHYCPKFQACNGSFCCYEEI